MAEAYICSLSKVQRHAEICKEINNLYERKNHDYGDSFHQTFVEEGMAMARIRLGDKFSRFKTLSRSGEQKVIEQLISDGLCVVICSSRAESFEGQAAIAEWLKHYGFPMVQIQARKVPSIVHVDDRTICFDGKANNLHEQIVNFKPWYERESESENH